MPGLRNRLAAAEFPMKQVTTTVSWAFVLGVACVATFIGIGVATLLVLVFRKPKD